MQIDMSELPKNSSPWVRMIEPQSQVVRVDDAESARAQVGFLPRLPHPGLLSGTPQLSVLGPVAFEITLKADDLRQLLLKAGVDESVPPQWDGTRIVVRTAGTVMAEWPEHDAILIQSTPLAMTVPQGFDLRAFTTLAFRGLKMPRDQAERLGARMATAPAWMLPNQTDENVGAREVALRRVPGTLVYDCVEYNSNRIESLTLMWNMPDRAYILSTGMSDSQAIATANAIE